MQKPTALGKLELAIGDLYNVLEPLLLSKGLEEPDTKVEDIFLSIIYANNLQGAKESSIATRLKEVILKNLVVFTNPLMGFRTL